MKRQRVIIILVVIIIAALAVISLGTVKLLRSIDGGMNEDSVTDSEVGDNNKRIPLKKNELDEIKIDEDSNKRAQATDSEAVNLMESDPATARAKYLDAARTYREAGNIGKASEMEANAMTAELLAQEKPAE